MTKKVKRKYYNFFDDVKKYPDAIIYIVFSQRGVGKTYSFLKECYLNSIRCIYMKRTIDDVNTVCTGDELADINPYKPINRDLGCNIKPVSLKKGIGYFKEDTGGENDKLVGYIAALNSLKTIRGVDFSDADYVCLDEFTGSIGDLSIRRIEGEQLLDAFMTFERDKADRPPYKPMKLVLFSNSDNLISPISETLEIIDTTSDLIASGEPYFYDEDRKIMIHHITDKEYPTTENQKKSMFACMQNTAWQLKAYGGAFTNNDFTQIAKKNIQHSRCIMKIHYKNLDIYCYENQDNSNLYFCKIPHQCRCKYNFDKESDRIKYLHYDNMFIRDAIMNDRAKFETYTMYDLLLNFTKKFALR